MRYFNFLISKIIILTFFSTPVFAAGSHKIRVLVEDSPITDFHISQRVNLHLMSSQELTKRIRAKLKAKSTQKRWRSYIQEARPTSKAEVVKLQKRFVQRLQNEARRGIASGLRKKVLEELINERLQISVAKKNNIVISDTVLDGQISRIAQRNNKKDKPAVAKKKFYKVLAGRGVGASTFKEKIRASLAWQQLVRRKFGRDVSFSDMRLQFNAYDFLGYIRRWFNKNSIGELHESDRPMEVYFQTQEFCTLFNENEDKAPFVKYEQIFADCSRLGFTNKRSEATHFYVLTSSLKKHTFYN